MKYKMIASDLDGTLNNDNHIVSEANIEAINKAVSQGIHVVLCSGRAPISLGVYEKKIGLNKKGHYGIGFNGATVYEADTNKVIFEQRMDKDLAIEIIKEVKRVSPDVVIAIFVKDDHVLAEKRLTVLEEYKEDAIMNIEMVKNLEDEIKDDVVKIVLMDQAKILSHVYTEIEKLKSSKYSLVYTAEKILEFLPSDINKAEGLAKLAKHLGIALDEIAAVGDNYNDMEMIKEVGFGMAVHNAVQPLKDIANHVLKSDNNSDALVEVVNLILEKNSES